MYIIRFDTLCLLNNSIKIKILYISLVTCSHSRVSLLFAESILKPNSFVGVKANFLDIVQKNALKILKTTNFSEATFLGEGIDLRLESKWK